MTSMLLAAVLTCADLATPDVDALTAKDRKVTLALEKTSLDRVFDALGEQAGFKPTFRGYTPVVGAAFEDVPLVDALRELATLYALRIRASAPDRLDIQAPATVGVGGVTQPRGKDQKRPVPVPGSSGKVILNAVICEDGTVAAVSPVRRTDEPRLVQSAMDAVRTWTYEPASKDGKPVAVSMTVVVDFQ